jgi:N-acetylneuraminic acid mutarotase
LTQIFDSATERFTTGPDLPFSAAAQVFTSIVPLVSGSFLLAGAGLNAPVGAARSVVTQLFDPAAGFTPVGDVATRGISDRTATPLSDGGALLTGGIANSSDPVSSSADRYVATDEKWHTAAEMLHVRVGHTATLLGDGRVLIAGGLSCCLAGSSSPEFFTNTAEIYDPATDAFTPTGSLSVARGNHAAAVLHDGRVLITGGDGNDTAPFPVGTEIFDPSTGQFSAGGDLQAPRDSHSAVTLTDGRVLVIGGEVPPQLAGRLGVGVLATEIFDPATGRWSVGPTLNPAFYTATVTMLSSGKVLVFGGQDVGGSPQSAAALFE